MLTDDELDQTCDVLIEHEGLIPWLYCDTRGFVTVGVGDKVSNTTVATMPFVHLADSRPAEQNEKLDAYAHTLDFFLSGLTAGAYRAVSDLRLPADFCRRRLAYRVKSEFVPAVERNCPQFASFPLGAKLVLVDIAYNVGVAGFADFQFLIDCCNESQFDLAAAHVHTKKDGENPKDWRTWGKRNMWRRSTMLLAAQVLT
jgi:hypothetical protein